MKIDYGLVAERLQAYNREINYSEGKRIQEEGNVWRYGIYTAASVGAVAASVTGLIDAWPGVPLAALGSLAAYFNGTEAVLGYESLKDYSAQVSELRFRAKFLAENHILIFGANDDQLA